MSHDNTLKTPTDPTPIDPTDPASASDFDDLALPQNFDEILRASTVPTACPLRKPARHLWIRVHPNWEQTASVLKLSGERNDVWILKPAIIPALRSDLVVRMTFVPYITRQGEILMWPLRIPKVGQDDEWARTALVCVQAARTRWVQVFSNQRTSSYLYIETPHHLSDPDWGTTTWEQLRELAFRPKLIDRMDHPILLDLRGER
jgi:hypothetical protein